MRNICVKFEHRVVCMIRAYQLAYEFYRNRVLTPNEIIMRLIFLSAGMSPVVDLKRRQGRSDMDLASLDADPIVVRFKQYYIELLGNNPSLLE